MTLVLSKQDVRDLVDMAALVDAVEGAMIEVSRGTRSTLTDFACSCPSDRR